MNNDIRRSMLPDVLTMPTGERVKSTAEWEGVLRPYYKELFLTEEYGRLKDTEKISVSATVSEQKKRDFAGKATVERIDFLLTKGDLSHKISCDLAFPTKAYDNPCPFFINISFSRGIPERYCPTEEIIDLGFGVFHVYHGDITSDDGDFTNGLAPFFVDGERTGDDPGKIIIWAYFLRKMMDYLLTRTEADRSAIGVAGHSRLGKTALLCAALDERFAFCCSNNSGCSGVAISRGKPDGAEHISNITKNFPFWFCPNYVKYVGNEEFAPFDQHALVALVAPRPMLVGVAELDTWADNDGQMISLEAASAAYELYGKRGFVCEKKSIEAGDCFSLGELSLFKRDGEHFFSRDDWQAYTSILRKHSI